MVLDSPMLSTDDADVVRANMRRLFWEGRDPRTARAARALRALVQEGVVASEDTGTAVQVAYEFGGIEVLERLLDLLASGGGSEPGTG